MKKWLTLLLGGACALSVFSFAACGGESSSSSDDSQKEEVLPGGGESSSPEGGGEGEGALPKTAYEAYASVVEAYRGYANNFTATLTYKEEDITDGQSTYYDGVDDIGGLVLRVAASGNDRTVEWNKTQIFGESGMVYVGGTTYVADGKTKYENVTWQAWQEYLADMGLYKTDFPLFACAEADKESVRKEETAEGFVLTYTLPTAVIEQDKYFFMGDQDFNPQTVEYAIHTDEELALQYISVKIYSVETVDPSLPATEKNYYVKISFENLGTTTVAPPSDADDYTAEGSEGGAVPETAQEAYLAVLEKYKDYATNFTSTTTYRETYSVSGDFTNSGVNTGTQIIKADGENRYVKISANWNEEDIYEREHHLVDGTLYRAVLVDGETSKDKRPQSAEEWEENLVDKEYAWSATDFPVYEYETELEEKLSMMVRDEEIVLTLTIEGELAETWAYRFYTGADHYAPTKVEYKLYLNEALEIESIEIQIDSYDDSFGARVYESTTYVDITLSDLGSTTVAAPADAAEYTAIN